MTATVGDRGAKDVEGILHLRHVPSLGYVQVTLVDADGRIHQLDPSTIKVVERAVVAIEDLERGDPLVGQSTWRRMTDLDSAIAEGLVSLDMGDGMPWDALLARMRIVLHPFVEAGWEVFDEETDPSEDDCVICSMKRPPAYLTVDHYPDGWTLIWETNETFDAGEDANGEPSEPTLQIGPEETEESVRALLAARGWL